MSSADFEPKRYAEEYRERALGMIEKKVEDEEIKAVPPAPRRTGQVVYPLDHQPPGIPITPRELQISSTR